MATGNCPWCDGALDLARPKDACTCDWPCGEDWCKAHIPDEDEVEDEPDAM